MVRLDVDDLPSLQEPPSKRKKTGESSSDNEGRLDNSRSNDGLLLKGETGYFLRPPILHSPIELESNGSSEDNHISSENDDSSLQYWRVYSENGGWLGNSRSYYFPSLEDFHQSMIWLESNRSPDREDNHLCLENGGRLDNSRSNDGLLLKGETGSVSNSPILLSPIELESNGSSEDNHISSENDDSLLQYLRVFSENGGWFGNSRSHYDPPLEDFHRFTIWLESNRSPDREDNHLCLENGGRLDNSRSNDGLLLKGEAGSVSDPPILPSPIELESNRSSEDNHVSSENGGRLGKSNDDLWMKPNNLPGGGIGSRIGKLLVSKTEIAKGSNGTIVFEGFYELRPVAVKRLVKGYHDRDDHVFNEIKNLTNSDLHPNIVRYYGVEYDQYFVYLALEHCACNLDDLIQAHSESSYNSVFPNDPASTVGYKSKLDSVKDAMPDVKLWRPDGHPSPFLLKLMRDVVSGLAHLHLKEIIHRDLKPQNVLITKNPSLGAKLCDMGISRCLPQDKSSLGNRATGCGTLGWQAPEQLCRGRQTRAMDMFSLGCVLFFCVTGGRHPFGELIERDINIKNNKMDLSLVESIPEAHDLISLLLNPDLKLRPKSSEVLRHPFFWSSEMRLSFLRDTSDRVQEDVVRAIKSDLLNELESKAPLLFAGNWNSKIEPIFMDEIRRGRHRPYDYSRVSDLLRAVRNKLSHYRELPEKVKELVGPVPEGFNNYFAERFPGLLMSSYEVVYRFCKKEECFREYFGSVDAV